MNHLLYKVNFKDIEWESPIEGMKCKIYRYGNQQLRIVEYTKEMLPHWCEKGHIGYLLEGKFEIEYENEKSVYQPGDGIFIPSGEKHKHKGKVLTDIAKVIFVEDV